MNEIANIHRNETIDYVLSLVRGLHRTEADRATFYATQPYAISLENIARERSGRLDQLVHAIEAGLFDQLDAVDAATEAFVDAAEAERYAQRDEYVNSDGAEAEPPTVADMRQIFGEPVEGRDYDVMPSQDAEAKSVRQIEREIAIEAGDDPEDGEH